MKAAGRKNSKTAAEPALKGTSHATWKFELEDTVNADPLCDGECLKIVRAYLNFMGSADACPYRSLIDLQVATGLAKGTIISRRKKLVQLGYFTPAGTTSDGAQRYRIVNARENHVLDHQTVMRETLRERAEEEKETERRKRKAKAAAMSPSSCHGAQDGGLGGPPRVPLIDVRGSTTCTDRGPPREPNYVEDTVEGNWYGEGSIIKRASFSTRIDVVVPYDFLIGDDVLVGDDISIDDEIDRWLPKQLLHDDRDALADDIEPYRTQRPNGGRYDA